jgi:hypothetical protein
MSYVIITCIIVIISLALVIGISDMNTEYPDYTGDDLYTDE